MEEHRRTGPQGDACHPSTGGEWFWATVLAPLHQPAWPQPGGKRGGPPEGQPKGG